MRRPEQYDAQVARIRQVSARVFREKGYEATTIDDLAEALGVTRAAIYYYYKRKQDILFDICHDALDAGYERLEKADPELPARERLRNFITDLIEGMVENLEAFAVLMQESSLRKEPRAHAIRTRQHQFDEAVQKLVEEGVAEGSFRNVQPRLATYAIMGMCNWTYRWYRKEKFEVQAIVEEFLGILERGLVDPAVLSGGSETP